MARSNERVRTGFYIEKDLLERCDRCWKAYGFSSRNEFVSEAILHFITTQRMEEIDDSLVERLADAIAKASEKGTVQISKGLFRYAVGQEMLMYMLADAVDLDPLDVYRLRQRAIKNVRKTRGKVSLEAIADFKNEPYPQTAVQEDEYWADYDDCVNNNTEEIGAMLEKAVYEGE